MTFAPRQDWNAYTEAIREHVASVDKAGLTPDDPIRLEVAFYRYADFVDTLQVARLDSLRTSGFKREEDCLSRWVEKIALRQKLIAIYQAMDASRDG